MAIFALEFLQILLSSSVRGQRRKHERPARPVSIGHAGAAFGAADWRDSAAL